MLNDLKPLVAVLAIAMVGFAMLRPLCLNYMDVRTYVRRRNIWLGLTVVGFISPSFGIYILITTVVLIYELRYEKNPLALFLWLLFVIPNTRFFIPTVIINNLFDLNQFRLLTFLLIIPFLYRWSTARPRVDGSRPISTLDCLLTAFLALQLVIYIPLQSATVSMRQAFLLVLDGFLVFYAFSKVETNQQLGDILAAFFVSSFLIGLVGSVEWFRGWLLYDGIGNKWGDPNRFAWVMRGDHVRATASAAGPLGLGWQLAAATGVYMYLRTSMKNRLMDKLVLILLSFALYATGSRGPWLTALVSVLIFLALRPGALRKAPGGLITAVVILAVMYVTPLKQSVIDRLPIIGTSDQETVQYRQQLAEVSWRLIAEHPFFGDPSVASRMEELRQGEGIIDIVNGYLSTLLFTGWVGMVLQGGFFIGALYVGFKAYLKSKAWSLDLQARGSALVGCFGGCLFFIAVAGHGPITSIMAGLLVSFSKITAREVVPFASSNRPVSFGSAQPV